jgi:hypothetical protein
MASVKDFHAQAFKTFPSYDSPVNLWPEVKEIAIEFFHVREGVLINILKIPKIEFFLLLPIENHCEQNVQILKSFLGKCTYIIGKLRKN